MKDEWWYALDGARKGPVKFEVLRAKVVDGSLSASDLIWTSGMSNWTVSSEVPVLKELFQSFQPPELPPQSACALPPELPSNVARIPRERFADTQPLQLEIPATQPTQSPELAGPWRRFFARFIDLWTLGIAVVLPFVYYLVLVSPDFARWLQRPNAGYAIGFLSIPLTLLVESIVFGVFGTTLGKWLLGVHIETLESKELWFKAYLYRQTGVYLNGLGTGFPLVSLFTMAWQHSLVKSGRATRYDEGLYQVITRKVSVIRYAVAVLLILAMIVLNGVFDLINRSYSQKNAAPNIHSPVNIAQQPIVDTPQQPVANSSVDPRQTESEHEKQVREHFNTILVAHPDFRAIVQTDAFKQWVSTSPERRRIQETGTTIEVVQVLHEYKNYSRQIGSNAFEHRKQLTEAERARNEAAYEALVRRN